MAEVHLSPAARADLAEIDEYSSDQFGQDVADAYLRGFNDVFAMLSRQPLAGAEKFDIALNIRSFTHRKHRIFYKVSDDTVLIVRIIHHARDAKRLLG